MAKKKLIAILLASLASGCAMLSPPSRPAAGPRVTVGEEQSWRNVATDEDAQTLDALPQLWTEALTGARRAGYGRHVAAEEALLAPAAALPYAAPAPGPYVCRILRLGAPGPGLRALSEGGHGFCFVGADRDQLSLTINAGPRRIGGYLWDEKDSRRLVFLGAQGPRGMPVGGYGDNRMRDLAGLLERIGPFRYRLTLPVSAERGLIVVELRAAAEQ